MTQIPWKRKVVPFTLIGDTSNTPSIVGPQMSLRGPNLMWIFDEFILDLEEDPDSGKARPRPSIEALAPRHHSGKKTHARQ